jgi:hypothetical protein
MPENRGSPEKANTVEAISRSMGAIIPNELMPPAMIACHFDDVDLWSRRCLLLTAEVPAVSGEVSQHDAQLGSAAMDS